MIFVKIRFFYECEIEKHFFYVFGSYEYLIFTYLLITFFSLL